MASLTRLPSLRHAHLSLTAFARSFSSSSPWQAAAPKRAPRGRDTQSLQFRVSNWSDDPEVQPLPPPRAARTDSGSSRSKMAARIVLPNAANHYVRGVLTTTRENAEFLRETGIESDHGTLWNLPHPKALAYKKKGLEISFSDRYTLNPIHLRFFSPRGDAWVPYIRGRYRAKLADEPLWVHSLVIGSGKAVVRQTVAKRLSACTHAAARQLAEEDPPVLVRGTVLNVVRETISIVQMDSDEFRQMMVEALRDEMKEIDPWKQRHATTETTRTVRRPVADVDPFAQQPVPRQPVPRQPSFEPRDSRSHAAWTPEENPRDQMFSGRINSAARTPEANPLKRMFARKVGSSPRTPEANPLKQTFAGRIDSSPKTPEANPLKHMFSERIDSVTRTPADPFKQMRAGRIDSGQKRPAPKKGGQPRRGPSSGHEW